jgi:hypothetical protein
MNDSVDQLAMKIFTQMAAQYTVRHGLHSSHTQASSLAREAFDFAEAYMRELEARMSRDKNGDKTGQTVTA